MYKKYRCSSYSKEEGKLHNFNLHERIKYVKDKIKKKNDKEYTIIIIYDFDQELNEDEVNKYQEELYKYNTKIYYSTEYKKMKFDKNNLWDSRVFILASEEKEMGVRMCNMCSSMGTICLGNSVKTIYYLYPYMGGLKQTGVPSEKIKT